MGQRWHCSTPPLCSFCGSFPRMEEQQLCPPQTHREGLLPQAGTPPPACYIHAMIKDPLQRSPFQRTNSRTVLLSAVFCFGFFLSSLSSKQLTPWHEVQDTQQLLSRQYCLLEAWGAFTEHTVSAVKAITEVLPQEKSKTLSFLPYLYISRRWDRRNGKGKQKISLLPYFPNLFQLHQHWCSLQHTCAIPFQLRVFCNPISWTVGCSYCINTVLLLSQTNSWFSI